LLSPDDDDDGGGKSSFRSTYSSLNSFSCFSSLYRCGALDPTPIDTCCGFGFGAFGGLAMP
jgi:hypothetical protein